MVRYQRYHQWRKGGEATENDEESQIFGLMGAGYDKRTRPKLESLLLLFILSCCFIFAPQLFNIPSSFICKLLSFVGFLYFFLFPASPVLLVS